MYDPGMFPALGTNNEKRNGGVPQEGDLEKHLAQYKAHVEELIPDVNNNGLIIIDFESWRPIFRQNFGVLKEYKELSYKIEQQRHPFWTKAGQEAEVSKFINLKYRSFFLNKIFDRRHGVSNRPVNVLLRRQ